MQRHGLRHFIAYTFTMAVYFLVAFLVYSSQINHFVTSESKDSVVKMSLSQFVPEAIIPPKPIIEKVVEPIEEVVIEKEPVKEPEVLKEIIPEPIIVEKVIEKPLKNIVKIQEKVIKKKKIVKKKKLPNKKPNKKPKTTVRQASSEQSQSTPAKVNKFWTAVRKKIDKHKFYPRIAKRRGMEGVVDVKFTILRNGDVNKISVKGPKIFHNSARNAVKSAFPIDINNAPISLPASINLKLRYQVR